MVVSYNLPITQSIQNQQVNLGILSGLCSSGLVQGGTPTNIYPAFGGQANGGVIKSIVAVTDDSAAHNLCCYIYNGTIYSLIQTASIPITAGTVSTVSNVDVMSTINGLPLDQGGKQIIEVAQSGQLMVGIQGCTSGRVVSVFVQGENY
jgi:hypothetical protein